MNRNLRPRTRLLLALPVAAVAFSLAACSGGATRPSVDELSSGIAQIFDDNGQGGVLTDDQYDCVAQEFLDSEVSDEDLSNIAKGQDLQTSESAKTLVTQTMIEATSSCITP